MTEKEAIEELKYDHNELGKGIPCDTSWGIAIDEAYGMAIKALEEIEQYRKIGTMEECREAREKQVPKKPDYEGNGYDDKGKLVYDIWICPSCGERYEVDYDDYEHCPKCGQVIDWSEEDETD